MKARKVEGLEPDGAAAAERGADRRGPGSTSCAPSPSEALEPGAADRPSTTCGSPPSGCATCSRSPVPASGEEAEAAPRAAKALQGVLGEIHDCDVMLPRAEGIESLETLLRTRRELLFHHFRELWQAAGERGNLGRPRAHRSV